MIQRCVNQAKKSDKTNNSLFNSKMWGKENNLTLESLCVVSVCVIMTEKKCYYFTKAGKS